MYFLPQELPRFLSEWWTIHDAMLAWGVSEDEAFVLWLMHGDFLGVTTVLAQYPGGAVIEYTVIPAGAAPPRRKNAACGGAAPAGAEPQAAQSAGRAGATGRVGCRQGAPDRIQQSARGG